MRAGHRMVHGLAPTPGMSPDDMRRAPRLEPVRRFTEFISWTALHAGAAEAALVARSDFTLWCKTCAVPADGLDEAEQVSEAAVEYISAYRQNPPEVADGVPDVIEYGRAVHEPDERSTRGAVRMEPALRFWWPAVATPG
ncbi:hypothetical protein D9753_06540 [Streptomyces dangxiongensis]|uniref:Uncharacterized protein n=2 Tax=Streptomyces dangxiongensis TaxID=1442032 RepID=A0A3G2J8M9_9ACTN|nr:hypothetical protein D9753_06540 [Streptomyces dangxiongensis]